MNHTIAIHDCDTIYTNLNNTIETSYLYDYYLRQVCMICMCPIHIAQIHINPIFTNMINTTLT